MLSRFKVYITPHWDQIRYEFVKPHIVDTIEKSCRSEDEKCFAVLKGWLEIDHKACYCRLFRALKSHDCNYTVEELIKCIIEEDR